MGNKDLNRVLQKKYGIDFVYEEPERPAPTPEVDKMDIMIESLNNIASLLDNLLNRDDGLAGEVEQTEPELTESEVEEVDNQGICEESEQ